MPRYLRQTTCFWRDMHQPLQFFICVTMQETRTSFREVLLLDTMCWSNDGFATQAPSQRPSLWKRNNEGIKRTRSVSWWWNLVYRRESKMQQCFTWLPISKIILPAWASLTKTSRDMLELSSWPSRYAAVSRTKKYITQAQADQVSSEPQRWNPHRMSYDNHSSIVLKS